MRIIVWLISLFRRADSTTPFNASERRFDTTGGRLTAVSLKAVAEEYERLIREHRRTVTP